MVLLEGREKFGWHIRGGRRFDFIQMRGFVARGCVRCEHVAYICEGGGGGGRGWYVCTSSMMTSRFLVVGECLV